MPKVNCSCGRTWQVRYPVRHEPFTCPACGRVLKLAGPPRVTRSASLLFVSIPFCFLVAVMGLGLWYFYSEMGYSRGLLHATILCLFVTVVGFLFLGYRSRGASRGCPNCRGFDIVRVRPTFEGIHFRLFGPWPIRIVRSPAAPYRWLILQCRRCEHIWQPFYPRYLIFLSMAPILYGYVLLVPVILAHKPRGRAPLPNWVSLSIAGFFAICICVLIYQFFSRNDEES